MDNSDTDTGKLELGFLPDPENWHLWPDLLALIDTAAKRGGFRAWDENDLAWIAIDKGEVIGVATTRMLVGGQAELMHIAGVRHREWCPHLEAMICDWARANDCDFLISQGRKGWWPIAKRLGWQQAGQDTLHFYEKRL